MATNSEASNNNNETTNQPALDDYDGLWDLICEKLSTPSRKTVDLLRCRTSIQAPIPNVFVLREEIEQETHKRKKIKVSKEESETVSTGQDEDEETHCYTYLSQGFSVPKLFVDDEDEEDQEEQDSSPSTGLGFELILRCILTTKKSDRAPFWPGDVLQFLGSYVMKSGNTFGYNQYIPLRQGQFQKQGLLLVKPQPDVIAESLTYGQHTIRFIEVIPVTENELQFVKGWSPSKMANVMYEKGLYPPLWSRSSIFSDPSYQHIKEECERIADTQGSEINCFCASSDLFVMDRSTILKENAERKNEIDVHVAVIRFSGGTEVVKTVFKRRLMLGLPATLEGGFFDQNYRLFTIYFEILEDNEQPDKYIFVLNKDEVIIRATKDKMKEMATQFWKQLAENDSTPVLYHNHSIRFFQVSKVIKQFVGNAVMTNYEYNFS